MSASSSSSIQPSELNDVAFPLVSVIIPNRNGAVDLAECLDSVLSQSYPGPIELCIVDDTSEDDSVALIERTIARPHDPRFSFKLFRDTQVTQPRGPGWARNQAIRCLATGEWLCLLDSDDVALPERLSAQWGYLSSLDPELRRRTIVGSRFTRIPEDSTPKYTSWANGLTQEQLYSHRFRCITLIQPTWFFHRSIWERVGGYEEKYPAHPEDLVFFHAHLKLGGLLHKLEDSLVKYRYSPGSASSKIHRLSLLEHRLRFLEETVLPSWPSFSIWGAGRDGRRVFMALQQHNQQKVKVMADISPAMIGKTYTNCWTLQQVPIVHFSEITAPFITCVSPDRYPEFVENLKQLGFQESIDYYFIM